MATKDHKEYLLRLELAAGHRKFGLVAPRKEPDDEDGGESGTGTSGLDVPEGALAHPLLAEAAQFSGEYNEETPVMHENPNAEKELQLRKSAELEKQLEAQKRFNPTPSLSH